MVNNIVHNFISKQLKMFFFALKVDIKVKNILLLEHNNQHSTDV